MDKSTEPQIAERLKACTDWSRKDDKWITRKYRFRSFQDAIRFVNMIADSAESMNHHPFISIDYRVVTLNLTTWKAGGLTELDFQSAERYNRLYASFAEETE